MPFPNASTAPVIVVEPFATYRIMNVSFCANFSNANLLGNSPYLSGSPHSHTAQHLAITNILQKSLRLPKVQQFVALCYVTSLQRTNMWHWTDLTLPIYSLILSSEQYKHIYGNFPFEYQSNQKKPHKGKSPLISVTSHYSYCLKIHSHFTSESKNKGRIAQTIHSMYDARAPSGPWPPSKNASILPYFQLFSLHPRIPSICSASLWTTSAHLVPGLVMEFSIKNLFLGILSSSSLIIWPAHRSLLILLSFRIFWSFYNRTVHYSIQVVSVLPLVLGHIFYAVFSFQTYLAFVLSFVLGSRLHFHNIILASLMFCIVLFSCFGGFVWI